MSCWTVSRACSAMRLPRPSRSSSATSNPSRATQGTAVSSTAGGRRSRSSADRRSRPARRLRRELLGEEPGAVERGELLISADPLAVDHDERHGPLTAELPDGLSERRVVVERDLLEVEVTRIEERLGADAEAAPLRRVENDSGHRRA